MQNKLAWYRRSNNKLELHVLEDGQWKPYRNTKYYLPDWEISTASGFRTAQQYLRLGYTYLEQRDGQMMEDSEILLYWAKYRADNPNEDLAVAYKNAALALRLNENDLIMRIEEAEYQDRRDYELDTNYGYTESAEY